jgi:hypothetical protein
MSKLRTVAVLGFIIDPLRLIRSTAIAKALPAGGNRRILSFSRRAEL